MNPIQYTSRTFASILADIDADPILRDKPYWWKRLVAGVGDTVSMWNNAGANNSYLPTAYTRRAVADLVALLDYSLAGRQTASGELLFHVKRTSSFPFTVAKADLAATTQGGIDGSAKRFEARADSNVAAVSTAMGTVTPGSPGLIAVTRAFTTGELVRLTTTGTLPGGLALATDYWAIRVSDVQIKLASSRANAYAGTGLTISDAGTGTHTIHLYSFKATCYQQESVAKYAAGLSDGLAAWQEYPLAHKGVLRDTIAVTVNSVAWARVDTLVDSLPTDKHFRVWTTSKGATVVQFGDGTYGAIPGAFAVEVEYAVGGGSSSNVSTVDRVSLYSGSDANLDGVSNPGAMTGGAEEELVAVAKSLAPLLLKARDRFVTSEDGRSLVLAYGGIAVCKVNRNQYGPLSCQVLGVASGGGNPSAGLRSTIQAFLISRTILEGIDVRFEAATITAVAVTSAAKLLTGYTWAAVEPYFRLGWRLLLSEAGQEIKDTYASSGIAAAVALINTIFSTSFGATDYAAVERLVANVSPAAFGRDLQSSDAFGFLDSFVTGLDYLTVASPSFPVAVAENEITTVGTLTLTEIP